MLNVKLIMDFPNVTPHQMMTEVFTDEGRKQWEQNMPLRKLVKDGDDHKEFYI